MADTEDLKPILRIFSFFNESNMLALLITVWKKALIIIITNWHWCIHCLKTFLNEDKLGLTATAY